MRPKIKNTLLGAIPFLLILVLWILSSSLGWIPHWILPSPKDTLISFISLLLDGTLFRLIGVSLTNAMPPFLLALLFAILMGVLIGRSRTIRKIFSPSLNVLYIVPSLAWVPFVILFFGFTRETIWAVIFISSFSKMIYSVISGVRNINPNWILAARNVGLSKIKIISKVILPGALPEIMTGVRLGFGSAWKSLVGVEMLVITFGGLGKFIWKAQWYFSFDKVLIGILIISVIGLVMEELVFKKIERLTIERWSILNE